MPTSRSIEPATTTGRSMGQPVAVVLGVSIVVFTGCWLATLSPFENFFAAAVRSTRSNGMTALDPVFYGVAGVAAFVLLLAVLRLFDAMLKRFSKADLLSGYPEVSIEEFATGAGASGISARVARESYQLLRQYYPDRMCIDLDQSLREDLKLTDDDVLQLHAGLLSRTERREMRDLTTSSISTVHDLLDYVERAPAPHLDGVAVPIRSAHRSSSERAAADSGFFTRDQASIPKRRTMDYDGPKRRASDSKVRRAYSGPHRRATDLLQMPTEGNSAERPQEDVVLAKGGRSE